MIASRMFGLLAFIPSAVLKAISSSFVTKELSRHRTNSRGLEFDLDNDKFN